MKKRRCKINETLNPNSKYNTRTRLTSLMKRVNESYIQNH